MRITNGMQAGSMLRSLQGSNERSMKLQEQLSSGRRINKPSDDPVAVARSLKLNRDLCENEQYTKNIQDAMSFLDSTDTAMSGMNDILQRVQEIAVNGSNGTLPQASRDALSQELNELLGQAIQVGNTTYSGTYIFGGQKVLTAPYTPVGGPPYTGVTFNPLVPVPPATSQINFEIAPGITDNINFTGAEAFGTSPNSIFEHIIALRDELSNPAGTVANIQPIETQLSADLDRLLNYQTQVGAKYNKLELSLNRAKNSNTTINQQIADTGDTDIAKATMQLKLEENVYQAALAVGARVIQPSLVDFLD